MLFCNLNQAHHCQAGTSRTWLEFQVSCLRLGSSRTNTAAHRDNLSAMIQPFDQQTAPEKSQWLRLRPRANDRNGFCLAVPRALALAPASRQSAATHEDSTSTASTGFLIKFWAFSWRTQDMPPPIFKAQYDDKVNLHVYSHSSTRSEMHASSTPKSDQRWGSDSHLESFNQSFEYSPVHNHLLCIICSGAPWLGTPGWHRHWEAAVAMAKRALGSARLWEPCLNAGSKNVEALKGKSPPNETVWLP